MDLEDIGQEAAIQADSTVIKRLKKVDTTQAFF